MIHQCKNFISTEPVEQFLYHFMRQRDVQDTEDNEDNDDINEIETDCKQWTTTDQIIMT